MNTPFALLLGEMRFSMDIEKDYVLLSEIQHLLYSMLRSNVDSHIIAGFPSWPVRYPHNIIGPLIY